jgi:hypothetical protein
LIYVAAISTGIFIGFRPKNLFSHFLIVIAWPVQTSVDNLQSIATVLLFIRTNCDSYPMTYQQQLPLTRIDLYTAEERRIGVQLTYRLYANKYISDNVGL